MRPWVVAGVRSDKGEIREDNGGYEVEFEDVERGKRENTHSDFSEKRCSYAKKNVLQWPIIYQLHTYCRIIISYITLINNKI